MKTVKTELMPNGNIFVSVPMHLKSRGSYKQIIVPGEENDDPSREAFLMAIARGRRWQKLLDEGVVENINQLADTIERNASYVARIIRISALAPELIERSIAGEHLEKLTVRLGRKALPYLWSEQIDELG